MTDPYSTNSKTSRIFFIVCLIVIIVIFAVAFIVISQSASGARGEDCVIKEAWTETIIDKPAYDETVVDETAWDEELLLHWQRYSWTGGPHDSDDPPNFPSSDWQPNVQGDPHHRGVAGAYFRSNGNSGKGDWFYLEPVTVTVHHPTKTHVVHHPALTHVVEHDAEKCMDEPTKKPTPTPNNPTPSDENPTLTEDATPSTDDGGGLGGPGPVPYNKPQVLVTPSGGVDTGS